jgi:hypothetical protein
MNAKYRDTAADLPPAGLSRAIKEGGLRLALEP